MTRGPRFTIETDDELQHRNFLNGPAALAALWNFSVALRQKCKYTSEARPDWGVIRELFNEHCGDVLRDYE